MFLNLANYDLNTKQMHDVRKHVPACLVCLALTHPDLSEAALAQFELQSQGLPRDLPRIFGEPLRLRLDCGANCGQPVAKPVGVLCDEARRRDQNTTLLHSAVANTHRHTHPHESLKQQDTGF